MKKSTTKSAAVQISSSLQMWLVGAAATSFMLGFIGPIMIMNGNGYVGLSTLVFMLSTALFPLALFGSAFVFGPAYKSLLARLFVGTVATTIGILLYSATTTLLRQIMIMTSQATDMQPDYAPFWQTIIAEYAIMGAAWVIFTYAVYKKWRA